MSTSNYPNHVSAETTLASLERLACCIYSGQSLDSIFALALNELRVLLKSDRMMLGQLFGISPVEGNSEDVEPLLVRLPLGPQRHQRSEENTSGLCRYKEGEQESGGYAYLQISHESLGTTTISCLNQTLWLTPVIESLDANPLWVSQSLQNIGKEHKVCVVFPEDPGHFGVEAVQNSSSGITSTPILCKPEVLSQREWPEHWRVKIGLIVPLWINQHLWGFIMAHRCGDDAPLQSPSLQDEGLGEVRLEDEDLETDQTERWQDGELNLIQQVAMQVAIAIQQADLQQSVQSVSHESERLDQLKEDFLSTVSHELRTPLSSIKMATEMMARTLQQQRLNVETNQQLKQYLQILQDETDREISLINDLLELSHLEAQAEPIFLQTINLNIWLPYLVHQFEPKLTKAGLQIRIEGADDLPPFRTDLAYLEGIVRELLTNAHKYTPIGGEIIITATTVSPHMALHTLVIQHHHPHQGGYYHSSLHRRGDHDHSVPDYVTESRATQALSHDWDSSKLKTVVEPTQPIFSLSVRNSGPMISLVEQTRIFDKFYRIPSHDPWKHEGTGLGLALLKCRVNYLQGVVRVSSNETWNTFTVLLPNLRYEAEGYEG